MIHLVFSGKITKYHQHWRSSRLLICGSHPSSSFHMERIPGPRRIDTPLKTGNVTSAQSAEIRYDQVTGRVILLTK